MLTQIHVASSQTSSTHITPRPLAFLTLIAMLLMAAPLLRAQWDSRGDFYNGARHSGHEGDYYGHDRQYDRDYHPGGVGPGGGAAIGAAGGAAMGVAFGGGLKGAMIGGAVGASIGAAAGKAHQNNERRDYYYQGRRY